MLFLNAVGIFILLLAVVAIAWLGWLGKWLEILVFFAVGGVGGRFFLGVVEIFLTPLALAFVKFARADRGLLVILVASIMSIIQGAGSVFYCGAVMLYFFDVKGPPGWLMLLLGISAASAPYIWASSVQQDDAHPATYDAAAAMFGSTAVAIVLSFKGSFQLAAIVLGSFFFLAAIYRVFYASQIGAYIIRANPNLR